VITAEPEAVWAALVDPDLVASCLPFVRRITADGDHWRWELTGLDVAGVKVAPTFTERMVLRPTERIEFHHDPPASGREMAGVEGWYALDPVPEGTRLATSMEITLELPLPRLAGGVVRMTMQRVLDQMGHRFSRNLLEHLHAREV
jgi:carbon monoxide dehydrogenase subunit G